MYCFFIEIETKRSKFQLQVAEIPPDELDSADVPEFHVHYDQSGVMFSVTLQLENGQWYDRNSRVMNDDVSGHVALNNHKKRNHFKGPFSQVEINRMGYEITKHMVIKLSERLNAFATVFPKPHLN